MQAKPVVEASKSMHHLPWASKPSNSSNRWVAATSIAKTINSLQQQQKKICRHETHQQQISAKSRSNSKNCYRQQVNLVEGEVSTQHEALVQTLKADGWNIKHCINCDSHVYANRQNGGSELLVNANLIVSLATSSICIPTNRVSFQRDQAQLMNLMNCDKYSMVSIAFVHSRACLTLSCRF